MRTKSYFASFFLISIAGFANAQSAIYASSLSSTTTSVSLDVPPTLPVGGRPDIGRPHDDAPKPPDTIIRPVLDVNVQVQAADQTPNTEESDQKSFTTLMLETSAGTFGDPMRYVQTMAGVTAGDDERNDFIVRGGNPNENGFVIDNIEVPSINQLALSDTTGGLVSMLDAAAIQKMTLHTDTYDSRFDERLSSIFEISTRPPANVSPQREMEMGIAGLGGSLTQRVGGSNVFVSARQSVMQWVTNDTGMNGVPHYRNAFVRADGRVGNDSWWGMSLTGVDSMKIRPSATDGDETNPYDIDYSGWRNTTGLNWQHIFSTREYGVASLAQAEQSQHVNESAQLMDDSMVYDERSRDAMTTLKYDWTMLPRDWLTVHAGARFSVDQLHYAVAQPIGLQNPYSADSDPVNAGAFDSQFATVSSAGYVEASANMSHGFQVTAGVRAMQWALGGHARTTSRATVSKSLGGRIVQVGFAEYTQMPPTLYLLSFNNLRTLQPIVSRQITASAELIDNPRARMSVEAYQKRYSDYPVAQAYPQLTLANITDTFGQAFLMFPMIGSGTGITRGAEWTGQAHATDKIELTGTFTYSRSWYAGLDGVLRRSNYDLPIVANVTGTWMLPHKLILAWRYTVTSGKPYTPDDLALSIAQDRDVYNLSEINGIRSNAYRRLDFSVSQEHKLGRGTMVWRAGLLNAMNHKNFYCELWEPHASAATGEAAQSIQYQMPLFPEGEVKYRF